MSKTKTTLPENLKSQEPTKTTYHFGGIEILKFEDLNLPQFELSVFASADILDGGMGGSGRNDVPRLPIT